MRSRTVMGGGGVDIHVEERGPVDGRPILLIHGFSQCRLAWTPHVRLRARGRVPTRRDGSPGPRRVGDAPRPGRLRRFAALGRRRPRRHPGLDFHQPVLVGWSYGGLVVADYLATYGEGALAGVVLVGAITEKGTADADRFAGEAFVALGEALESTDAERSVAALESFVRLCVHDDLDDVDCYRMLGYNVTVPPDVRAALQGRTVDHEATLPSIETPVLLVHGEEDAVVRPAAARKHARLFPNATLRTYADVCHSPFFEAPGRFEGDLRSCVDDL